MRKPTAASIGMTACLLPILFAMLLPEGDLAALACAAIALITALSLLVLALDQMRRRRFTALAAWAAYSLGALALLTHFSLARDRVRWLILSRSYTASALADPAVPGQAFLHVAWDAWGFAGQDTTVYLVFDPADSLATHSGARPPITAPGLPCEVDGIRRLGSRWYAVRFYTNIAWTQGGCQ